MLRKMEWGLATLATALVVTLHFIFMTHAGGLWRDEAGVVNLATMPHLSDVWSNLYFDSFPVFWPLVLRLWTALGMGGDIGLRFLGLLVGLLILAALWFNARTFKTRLPLLSLILLGLSPTILIWCDSLRAWGLGAFWMLMTFGLMWRVANSPARWNITLATLSAVAAVQTTYYNSVLLFAICAAGAAVAGLHRHWRRCLVIAGIGVIAAISLLPYVSIFRRGGEHYIILRATEFSFTDFCAKILETLSFGGLLGPVVWALVLMTAVVAASRALLARSVTNSNAIPAQRDLLLYSTVALIVGVAGYFFFLHLLRYYTRPWYYAALLALGAVVMDNLLSVLSLTPRGRQVRVGLAAFVLAVLCLPAWNAARTRLTTLDLIARQLNRDANRGDLIVVNPWYCAIGFPRYYSGSASWLALPNVGDYRFHRYDLAREFMMNPNQTNVTADVLDRMGETLKAGHTVWVVGSVEFPATGHKPLVLPAAPNGPWGWLADPYFQLWSEQAATYIQAYSRSQEPVRIPGNEHALDLENLPLLRVEGWRDQ